MYVESTVAPETVMVTLIVLKAPLKVVLEELVVEVVCVLKVPPVEVATTTVMLVGSALEVQETWCNRAP